MSKLEKVKVRKELCRPREQWGGAYVECLRNNEARVARVEEKNGRNVRGTGSCPL